MPDFKLPLSGNVTQTINPWTVFFNPIASQVGLVNVNLGNSSNPAVEFPIFPGKAVPGICPTARLKVPSSAPSRTIAASWRRGIASRPITDSLAGGPTLGV